MKFALTFLIGEVLAYVIMLAIFGFDNLKSWKGKKVSRYITMFGIILMFALLGWITTFKACWELFHTEGMALSAVVSAQPLYSTYTVLLPVIIILAPIIGRIVVTVRDRKSN